MKIWSKGFDNAPEIDAFTVGKDRELDLMLAPWDILGTMAHITMLSEVGLLGKDELAQLLPELKKLHQEAVEGRFTIEGEDVHSEVEARLTAALGDIGKKVHTGRSRNDQVAVDIKLYTRAGGDAFFLRPLAGRLRRKPRRRSRPAQGGLGRHGREPARKRGGLWLLRAPEPLPHHGTAGVRHPGLQQHLCADVPRPGRTDGVLGVQRRGGNHRQARL